MKPVAGPVLKKAMMRSLINNLALWLLTCCIALPAGAQPDIAVRSWRAHISYNSLVSITNSPARLYAANRNGLFSYNPATGEVATLNRLSGLNDSDITTIGYNEATATLIIAYANGNIDLLQDNRIINFPYLKITETITTKQINHMYQAGDLAYLSGDFGILIIDLTKQLVLDSYLELGPQGEAVKVFSTAIYNDSLFMATERGLARGSLQDNLKDFNQWRWYGSQLPSDSVRVLLNTGSGLLAAYNNAGIYQYKDGSWQSSNQLTGRSFIYGHYDSGRTLLTTPDSVFSISGSTVTPLGSTFIKAPQAAIYFGNQPWVADGWSGLLAIASGEAIYPDGPLRNEVTSLYSYNDVLLAMYQAHDNAYLPLRNPAGFGLFKEGRWQNYTSLALPGSTLLPEFYDISGAAWVSATGTLYLSSFGYGLLKIQDDNTEILDENSPGSTLINLSPPERNVWVSALTPYASGVAMINFGNNSGLHLYDGNSWQALAVPWPGQYGEQLLQDFNGQLWIRVAANYGGGIVVYDPTSGQSRYLTEDANSGKLPDNKVYDIALDQDDRMWVATARGIGYYYNASFVLTAQNLQPVLPVYENEILFKDEPVTALAIDGGNRVWMGTKSGIWLFDDDGRVLVEHFNKDNSPLPADEVLDIAINHRNGEVFVATTGGLVSIRGTATQTEGTELKIFPNPVMAGRDDIVTFEGVPTNAEVWVTDAGGRLVFKTNAHGNTAVWSGLTSLTGLSSGVYFVFVTDADGNKKQAGKLAIIY